MPIHDAPQIAEGPSAAQVTNETDRSDLELAASAASSLRQPHKIASQIVEDVFIRLRRARLKRELDGLDHWSEYAPSYLGRLLARHERLRLRAVEKFYLRERKSALAHAETILGDRREAEDVVCVAFGKVLAGSTGPSHFYRLLSHLCLNRRRDLRREAKVLDFGMKLGSADDGEEAFDPACPILSQGDPLQILLHGEAIREGILAVQSQRKHRDVRRLKWWRVLQSHHRTDELAGKGSPQGHI